jgi:hypothetical protein
VTTTAKQLLARPTFFLLGLGGLKKEAGALAI